MKRAALGLLLAATLATAGGARAEEPSCVQRCRDMAAKKQLREGVNEQGCVVRVCQEDGRRYYKSGDYAQALASLDLLAEKLERSPSFHLDRGNVYYAMGRFPEALADYDASLAAYRESFQAAAQRGHTLIRLKRLDDARAQFEKLLDTPGAAREFRGLLTKSYLKGNVGVIDVMRSDLAAAKQQLDEARRLDGRNTQAAAYLFRVIPQLEAGAIDADGIHTMLCASEDVGLGHRERAEPELAQLIARQPKFAEAYFLEDEILRSAHRYEDCERVLQQGERAIPSDVDLKAARLRCTLLKLGPTSSAAKPALGELKRLSAANPDNALLKEILHALDLY